MTESKLSLNLGCGPDDWGDVRVDVNVRTQTGDRSRLNLRADAHHLPFRDDSFSFCRCWHVIEHVQNPRKVLNEISRTCDRASVKFPVDEGYYMQMAIGVFNLDWNMFIHAFRTLRRRAHRWTIRPFGNARLTDRYIGYPRYYGRKGKLLARFLPKFRYYYEYEVSLP